MKVPFHSIPIGGTYFTHFDGKCVRLCESMVQTESGSSHVGPPDMDLVYVERPTPEEKGEWEKTVRESQWGRSADMGRWICG